MEDLSSYDVGDTVTDLRGDGREYEIIEKEMSSVGKINAVIVTPVGEGDAEKRIRIAQSEWGDIWTA